MQRAALALASCLLVSACAGGGQLDAKAVQQEAESVQSLAAEGALLAGEAAGGTTTSSFVRVHAGELAKTAAEELRQLSSAPAAPGEEAKAKRAAALAGTVAELLRRLEKDASPASARALGRRLERVAGQAERLAAGSS